MRCFKSVMFILLIFLSALVSCAAEKKEAVDTEAVRQAIEAQNAKFAAAFNSQDAAGVAAIYTVDATSLPPYRNMIQGRPLIEESNKYEFGLGLKNLRLGTVSLDVHGDIAHEVGEYIITIQPEGKEETEDSGKYMAIWKKQADGNWLIDKDIWNSSIPLPSMVE